MKRALLVVIPILSVLGAISLWPSKRDLRFQIVSDVASSSIPGNVSVRMGATTYLLPPEIVGATVEYTKIAGGDVEVIAIQKIKKTPETEIKYASHFWSEDLKTQNFAFVFHDNAVSSEPLHVGALKEGQILSGVGGGATLLFEGYPLRLDTFVVHTGDLPKEGWPGRQLEKIPVSELTEITEGDSELVFYTITVKRGDAKAP